ncbi:hypothetical protein A2U01_0023977, partial [Trifolium medium]|nr:hypothetical protein [Trifolium medium]
MLTDIEAAMHTMSLHSPDNQCTWILAQHLTPRHHM